MKRKIITTADGSKTIQIEEWNEQYHSVHGAIQEANHVYIKQGLLYCFDKLIATYATLEKPDTFISDSKKISILEIGFGTGLNALLTLLQANAHQIDVRYVGVEAFPISLDEMTSLNYSQQLNLTEKSALFTEMHEISWEQESRLSPYFTLQKQKKSFQEITDKNKFDLIYFDAFGARVQPELWTESIFKIMCEALHNGGILVTYAAKGSVRRAMQTVGFIVEKLPGPPGKREMLRARKSF